MEHPQLSGQLCHCLTAHSSNSTSDSAVQTSRAALRKAGSPQQAARSCQVRAGRPHAAARSHMQPHAARRSLRVPFPPPSSQRCAQAGICAAGSARVTCNATTDASLPLPQRLQKRTLQSYLLECYFCTSSVFVPSRSPFLKNPPSVAAFARTRGHSVRFTLTM